MELCFQAVEYTEQHKICGKGVWKSLNKTRRIEVIPWDMVEQGLTDNMKRATCDSRLQTPFSSLLLNFTEEGQCWHCSDGRVKTQVGKWSVKDDEFIVIHLVIEPVSKLDEWRIYQIDPKGNKPPQRLEGRRGNATFDETTGIIEIAVANGPIGSRHYIFRPSEEGWPEAYLEGWTEVTYLRNRVNALCYRVQELSGEKQALADAMAEALGGLDQLIGPETLKSIRNPLAALLRPNDSCMQHCAEEIRAKLEAVRARLQSVTAELSS